ncbi:hypothetical protein [Amycolatopsis suaedae]|uniref:Lipoprotein n=1 Tax=Amycolatopsis suaedae TaxID=2510978 RepID=A0A4V2EMK7_9PSEU|nr:hypothetical protein [Amycolatopsis suaedae]RZQ65405.1 hypothetical protein EWH70_05920 [Amycolatopsis suaedae]
MKKLGVALGVVLFGVVLAGCDQVNEAVNTANKVSDKVTACSEAVGLASFDPNQEAEQLQADAKQKAQRLSELGTQVNDQGLQQTLNDMAASYTQLAEQKLDQVTNVSEWVNKATENLNRLRQACL